MPLLKRTIRRFAVIEAPAVVGMFALLIATASCGAAEDDLTIVVCLGDSITAGVSADPAAVPYPTQLQGLLGAGYQVENSGNPSQTTAWLLDNFPAQVTSKSPDMVVVLAGVNDINAWDESEGHVYHPENVIDRLRQIGNQVGALGASTVYLTIWPDNDFNGTRVAAIHDINHWILNASAGEVPGSQAIDIAGQLLAQTGPDDHLLDDAYHDGSHLHLNQLGYTKVAEAVANSLVPEPAAAALLALSTVFMICTRRPFL